ncbi:uncharacterized protein LACBIDRAFT_313069 [Laccaria bicolor S238N-H82]|uniref:Predicted protein n=1 Tax=Laccaria bicolor (strain S238N-H82 / ATCC MYA-4686) TaxID=486041 RepID=B0DXG4_LACBS|nr:uncharacterized protein LACBIDRAFT_313069 [Laccaria bicolor S238N-H82]EDR00616.1 predicted protein [Laccaria bicolor S238N-H82]|eukprot:XP_001888625.1 predicted protein [Laccaria bicolor S238N-H82]
MAAILRAMDRSVSPRPPKTEDGIKQELAAKNADPAQPGRRMKRVRQVRVPELKLMGALIEVVGLLSAPASQLVAVVSEASVGKPARTLEGLKKSLEGSEKDPSA